MDFVEKAYSTVIGGVFILFIFCRTAIGLSTMLSTYCRPVLLAYLVYPISHSGFWSWLPSPLHLILIILYSIGTGVCNFIGIQSVSEAGSRAARLSLANLVPMFLSGGYEFGSRLLGVSLATYGAIHRAVGIMAVVQAVVHVAIMVQTRPMSATDNLQFYGLLGSSMLLSVIFLPLVKKRVYDVFLKTHQGCALVALYAIWQHAHAPPNSDTTFYLLGCIGLFIVSHALQLVRILFRNVVFGKEPTTLILDSYEENVARVTLSLPRPWAIRAGERIDLSVPYVGLLYLFQKHPFTISWWEEDDISEAFSISLLLRPRSGFTRKLVKRIKPHREYRAWIDGPFGPASVSACGFSGEVGDYGHVFFIATGIGIAAQLPYIKELLDGHHQARVRTKKVTLVWQLDQEGDWQSARDWLQMLVEQDEGYLLSVIVYNTLQAPSTGDPRRIGHHGLIEAYGGMPNLAEQLASEMKNQMGRMLVAVSARRCVREQVLQLVRAQVGRNLELFEQEFQPWARRRSWWSYLSP